MSSLKSRMPSFRNGRSSLKSGMPSSSLEKKVLSLKTPLNPFRYEGDIREGVKGVCKLKFGN